MPNMITSGYFYFGSRVQVTSFQYEQINFRLLTAIRKWKLTRILMAFFFISRMFHRALELTSVSYMKIYSLISPI